MKYRYYVIKETYMAEEMSRTAYGVAVGVEQDGCLFTLESFSDVCSEREGLDELVGMCNSLELDCDHLRDVLEDFAAGWGNEF